MNCPHSKSLPRKPHLLFQEILSESFRIPVLKEPPKPVFTSHKTGGFLTDIPHVSLKKDCAPACYLLAYRANFQSRRLTQKQNLPIKK